VQQGLIEQAIAALDAGVDRAEDAAQRAEDAADRAEHAGGGGEPTENYNNLYNKPRIEGVELEGNKRFSDLGLESISEQDIDDIIFGGI
jgi:IS5 family transposase